MRRRIPSMEALIAFEAAARHLSFTRSADELALTQSAVGRQIASLEDYVGAPLFARVRKRLLLTAVGGVYARQVRSALEQIERDTLAAMAQRGAGGVLEIAIAPTLATRWLIPRLPAFYAAHPDITLNLSTRSEPFLFEGSGIDAAIQAGNPVWPGTIALPLFGEALVPVCSPGLLVHRPALPLAARAALSFPLLHQSGRPQAWRQWLAQSGVEDEAWMRGQRFELFSMLVEAARAGLGLALVPHFLVAKELASGELRQPFEAALECAGSYFLVYPESRRDAPLLGAFAAWLLAAARAQEAEDHPAAPLEAVAA